MQESNSDLRQKAVHEAGHAVQAHVNGLGILFVSLMPPAVRVAEQAALEEEGYNLANPSRKEDRLVEFYRRDIEVRVAGPLALLRYQYESLERDLDSVDPESIKLGLWGGMEDEKIAVHCASVLARWFPLRPEPYVAWVKKQVWVDTIRSDEHWSAIQHLANELESFGRLDRKAAVDIITHYLI